MSSAQQPKVNPDAEKDRALIAEFIANGGKITKCKTREMPSELGISNNTWNKKLTKVERDARKAEKDSKEVK